MDACLSQHERRLLRRVGAAGRNFTWRWAKEPAALASLEEKGVVEAVGERRSTFVRPTDLGLSLLKAMGAP